MEPIQRCSTGGTARRYLRQKPIIIHRINTIRGPDRDTALSIARTPAVPEVEQISGAVHDLLLQNLPRSWTRSMLISRGQSLHAISRTRLNPSSI
jgi:hypothetical protein